MLGVGKKDVKRRRKDKKRLQVLDIKLKLGSG